MNGGQAFNARTMVWVVLASMIAAAGLFLLSTYAPDFRQASKGGATALSKGATGFAGLREWLSLNDRPVRLARSDDDLVDAGLLIVPIQADTPEKAIDKLLARRAFKTTLFVLPKHVVVPDPEHAGWDKSFGTMPPQLLDKLLRRLANSHSGTIEDPLTRVEVEGFSVPPPTPLQWIADPEPIIAAAPGKAILSKEEGQPHYILADPDFLNNAGLADPARAAAALALVDRLRPNNEAVMLDITLLGGSGNGRSLQKLLVEPPFLALTLSLLVAALLALAHGFVRFGPPAIEARAIAFGKYALADSTARLFRRAGRLGALGDKYAALMRARAGARLGAPAGLSPAALDAWLDARSDRDGPDFTTLAAAVEAADDTQVHAHVRALHDWIDRRKREG